jgi:hypothetical protein
MNGANKLNKLHERQIGRARVREREKARQRERDGARERESESERARERETVKPHEHYFRFQSCFLPSLAGIVLGSWGIISNLGDARGSKVLEQDG